MLAIESDKTNGNKIIKILIRKDPRKKGETKTKKKRNKKKENKMREKHQEGKKRGEKEGIKKGTMPSKKKKTKIESLINHSYQLLSFLEIHQETRSIREEI